MIHGIERRKVFKDNKDRNNFKRELGISLTEMGRVLGMSPSAVDYAVQRGDVIATDSNY